MQNYYFDDETLVYDAEDVDGTPIRVYSNGVAWQSATYLSEERKYDLVFPYMREFNRAFEIKTQAKRCLLIGGAGYSYPKYVISHYPDVTMDVVDPNPSSFEIAWQQFFLEDLYRDYHLDENERLVCYEDDGLSFLKDTDEKYDIIIDDAFNDMEMVYELLNYEAFSLMKEHLNDGGILVFNLPGERKTNHNIHLMMIDRTLKEHFAHTAIIPAFVEPFEKSGNYILMASDNVLPYSSLRSDDAQIIHEDKTDVLEKAYRHFSEYFQK